MGNLKLITVAFLLFGPVLNCELWETGPDEKSETTSPLPCKIDGKNYLSKPGADKCSFPMPPAKLTTALGANFANRAIVAVGLSGNRIDGIIISQTDSSGHLQETFSYLDGDGCFHALGVAVNYYRIYVLNETTEIQTGSQCLVDFAENLVGQSDYGVEGVLLGSELHITAEDLVETVLLDVTTNTGNSQFVFGRCTLLPVILGLAVEADRITNADSLFYITEGSLTGGTGELNDITVSVLQGEYKARCVYSTEDRGTKHKNWEPVFTIDSGLLALEP